MNVITSLHIILTLHIVNYTKKRAKIFKRGSRKIQCRWYQSQYFDFNKMVSQFSNESIDFFESTQLLFSNLQRCELS